jgi:hypothetical protein
VFGVFTVAGLAATAAARTGWTGEAGSRDVGWTLPARVEADPALLREANRLVTTWCTAAAVMSAVPVVLLALRGLHEPLPIPLLLAAAAYGFVLVLVGGYPFEKIGLLGDEGDGPGGL